MLGFLSISETGELYMSMIVIEQKKNDHFVKKGDRISEVNIILKGKVRMASKNDEFVLKNGAVIGLMDCATGYYSCDYYALEDTLLVTYSYETRNDLYTIFEEQPQYMYAFLHATLVETELLFSRYKKLEDLCRQLYLFSTKQIRELNFICKQNNIEHDLNGVELKISGLKVDEPIVKWQMDYAKALYMQSPELMKQFYSQYKELAVGEIFLASSFMNKAIIGIDTMRDYINHGSDLFINDKKEDLLELWFETAKKIAIIKKDCVVVENLVKELQSFILEKKLLSESFVKERFLEFWKFDFEAFAIEAENAKAKDEENEQDKEKVFEEPTDVDYFEYVLSYAGYDEQRKEEIRNSKIEDVFYEIYERVFFNSIKTEKPNNLIMLFLVFGVTKPELVDEQTIDNLTELVTQIIENNAPNYYTVYQWLFEIYEGKKETSRNEFGLDYQASLRELRKANRITEEDEKIYKLDRERMVKFEIENLFKVGNRITSGRNQEFSPVFDKKYMSRTPQQIWISPEKIQAAFDKILKVDYSCFYREVLFYDEKVENGRFYIQKEVKPDMILFPNVGNNIIMWQENVGSDRESAARFLLPIMSVMNLDDAIIENVGRYRWEMCRKLQGARWNDISEHSLTSEYFDYIQYYKKNHELSSAVKEKIKNAITRHKGSCREVFTVDYVNWVKYESQGNFRVNKVVRNIFSKYIPFSSEIRYKLMENPLYRTAFSIYENITINRETKFKNILKRYKDSGGELTQEMKDTLHFYQK